MKQNTKKLTIRFLLVLGLLATVALAQKSGDVKAQIKGVEEKAITHQEQVKDVKQTQIKGVEIKAVNSTVQDGVKSGTQVNLEKVLKLLTKPKPKSKPQPAAAAGLGGGKKPKPSGGPGGDSRKNVNDMRERLNTGS